jgi:methyl coenzyme M reductase beta subunit
MMVLVDVVIPMVENADEVAQDQNAVVQVSEEVDPVDVEDIKGGSLFVLFFAYLSDK